jgi:TonB family protein
VGNTTFGDPNKEKFTPPQEVPKPTAVPFDLHAYKDAVFHAMNKIKQYPRKARMLGLEGNCIVKLLVNKDGSLAGEPVMMGKGTGHDVLDTECVRMAKEAAPYPPVVGETEFPVHLIQHIDFRVIEAGK